MSAKPSLRCLRPLFRNASPHQPIKTRTYATATATAETSEPKVIFSGIQPTGVPHLGNYLGALQQWVKLQHDSPADTSLIFSVVDLHAITIHQNPEQLRASKREMLAALLAVGLDPRKSTMFFQSDVPAHSELMWILSCSASVGYLSRMTQWKSKLDLDENANALDSSTKTKLKLGLFSYPVLQAADILVHRATHVPVGHDQSQHLEFARECATGFNHLCDKKVLVAPTTLLSPAKRVMSLTNPNQKMSKSHPNPKSRILLTDDHPTILKKFRGALTDSLDGIIYDPSTRPGVSNLIEIAYYLEVKRASDSIQEYAKRFEESSLKALKEYVADVVEREIGPVRERFAQVLRGREVEDAAEVGRKKARASAEETMRLVRDAVGL